MSLACTVAVLVTAISVSVTGCAGAARRPPNYYVAAAPSSSVLRPPVVAIDGTMILFRVPPVGRGGTVWFCDELGRRAASPLMAPPGTVLRLPTWRAGDTLRYVDPLGEIVAVARASESGTLLLDWSGAGDYSEEYRESRLVEVDLVDSAFRTDVEAAEPTMISTQVPCDSDESTEERGSGENVRRAPGSPAEEE